ncbi:sensor histidine kinase [Ruminococcus flavefaciens]|uniref:Sensor histidine kinase YesM n=1 Tax=Ruminococcus flavefaciens TaxID=1265 RepID=A0A1M7I1B4_RUMFL|nr:ATP-binding protein [Ruminococcus flavefaciens]SHM34510.1 Sensor histidine kinase YesM [Ruminococcus flavefaciens]
MIKLYQLTPFLIQLMYGTAFSLCTFITMNDLFYKKIRSIPLFYVLSGVIFGIISFIQNRYFGGIDSTQLYILHTFAMFFILTNKSINHLLSLIFAEMFSVSLISSVQTAVFSVSNRTERSFTAETLLYFAAYIISAGAVFLLKQLVCSDDREPLGRLQMLLLTSITFSGTAIIDRSFSMSNYIPDVSPEAAIPSVLMLMSVTVLLLLSVKQQQAKRFREMNELSEKYMTAQAKHFEQARTADTAMRMLRHDMKNHIAVMNGLYETGKTTELGKYLKGLSESFADTQAVNITGNEIADAIITEKRAAAEKEGTELVCEGILKGLDINAVTLCTVLSNLLDNAIEAAKQVEPDRIITLTAKRTGSFYYISISNPCAEYVDVSPNMVSSKSDREYHGLGLKSVRSALEKCGGTIELSCKEAGNRYIFTAEVILPAGQ